MAYFANTKGVVGLEGKERLRIGGRVGSNVLDSPLEGLDVVIRAVVEEKLVVGDALVEVVAAELVVIQRHKVVGYS